MEFVELTQFGPAEYDQIVDGEEDPYGTEQLGIEWGDKSGHLVMMEDGRIIGHAGWVPANVRVSSNGQLRVLGLGGVMVHRGHRSHGLGYQLVAAAMDRMRQLDTTVGMLFCRDRRVSFYERLGWFPVQAEVTADQPGGSVLMPLVTCWTPLVDGAVLPESDLHVEGLPF